MFLDHFARLGGDVPRALARAKIRVEDCGPEGVDVRPSSLAQLMEILVTETNDPLFGLRAAAALPRGTYGVVEYAMRSSATLGEAFAEYVRFQRLASEAGHFSVLQSGQDTIVDLVWDAPDAPWVRHLAEGALAIVVALARDFCGKRVSFSRAWFSHAAPGREALDELEAFFGCPVRFGRGRTGAVFATKLLNEPIHTADPVLRSYMLSLARGQLASVQTDGGVARNVERLYQRASSPAQLQAAQIAKSLGMSPRNLRRRLALEGTSVREIESRVCTALCERYLSEPNVSVGEVAQLLGYSSANAFGRAVVRWTGRRPSELRTNRVER